MNLYATLDTSIFGRSYHQGEQVDDTGWIRAQYLQMLDLGLVTTATGTVVINGPEVMPVIYTPSMPLLSAAPHGYVVAWDGHNADGSDDRPPDWSRCEIHSSVTSGFTFGPSTLRGTFESSAGGEKVCIAGLEYSLGLSDTYEVLLVYRNTAGVTSEPSDRATIMVGQIDMIDIPDLSLTVVKFQSKQHLLY
jgi:hypothetical protein